MLARIGSLSRIRNSMPSRLKMRPIKSARGRSFPGGIGGVDPEEIAEELDDFVRGSLQHLVGRKNGLGVVRHG
jgi:hypothetical protein